MQRRWDKSRPPSGPFTLNEDCPQAQGIVAWHPMLGANGGNIVTDYVKQTHLANSGGIFAMGNSGMVGLSLNGSSNFANNTISPVTTIPLSIMTRAIATSTSGDQNLAGIGLSTEISYLNRAHIAIQSGELRALQSSFTGGGVTYSSIAGVPSGVEFTGIGVFSSLSSRTVYLNGVAGTTNTTTHNQPTSIDRIQIGAVPGNNTNVWFLGGLIGETCFWNLAITSDVIARLNDAGLKYELYYPLRSRKWFSIGGTKLTLSGAAITSAMGSFGKTASKTLSGQSAISSCGSAIPRLSLTLSGAALTALTGSLSNVRSVTLSGGALSTALGTLGVLGVYSANLTGQGMASQQGTFSKAISANLAGIAFTSPAGSLTPVIRARASGQALVSTTGILAKIFNVVLTGDLGTAQQGSVNPIVGGFTVLSGISIGTSLGAFDITCSATLIGNLADAVEGSLVAQLSNNLTGSLASLNLGDLTASVEGVLNGQGLSLTQGNMVVSLSTSIAGISTTLYLGTLGDGRNSVEWVLVEASSNAIIATSHSNAVTVAQSSQQFIIEAKPGKVIN